MSDPENRAIRLVRRDSMGRINLNKVAANKFYHVYLLDEGVIVLKPVKPDDFGR